MKILYIIPRFHPFKGGAEKNIESLAIRAAKNGNDVIVFTTNVKFNGENLDWEKNYNGLKIIRHWSLNSWLYLGFYPKLLPDLLKSDADIIHVSGFGFIWVEFCLIFKRLFDKKVKIINTPHGPFMAFTKSGIRGLLKKIYTSVLKIVLPFIYDAVIAVVDKQKEWINKDYRIPKDRIFTIPNGIDESYIEPISPKYKENEKIIITYLNRMEWYKGIQTVLLAMDRLDKASLEKIEFWIMGRAGAYTKKILEIIEQKNLKEYTRIIYAPTDMQRDEAFLKSQINILPSKWEATGIALLEAMAKGNVIITTYQNQAWEMLINKNSGYAFEFGDDHKLSTILNDIINDDNKRNQIIQNNLKFVKNFTWEAIYPDYKNLITSLVNGN
ncbi:glycosyltransferase family 4 protein [Candidatus Dojkabacteria bacterium]|uniref:Glycosyltransferase family 4 protein n=1 Tax=Candidatus Dojkabacteria bacterium TaxID=2099670 RepID=A0A955RM79_9BACT|nr:glycosyltransferase family 4 protein [Candidatus Dojkabacteria bacterium]